MKTDEKLYSRKELSTFFGVSPHTIRKWEKEGLVKRIEINRRTIRYRLSQVMDQLEDK